MQRFFLCLTILIAGLGFIECMICNGTTTCLHGGTFNLNNCSCSCASSAYSGKYCQYVNCETSGQPSNCTSYPSSSCGSTAISNYCPLLCNSSACTNSDDDCNIDGCLNGGTYNATTCTCQCINYYYGLVCEKICSNNSTCSNGGTWNWTACACNCPTGYYGPTCANSLTTACAAGDPASCATTYNSTCSSPGIRSYCPNKCGLCNTTTSSCTTLTCAYGITFNSGTCSCPCNSGFYGSTCASFNCSSGVTDQSTECSTADCSVSTNILFCPYTCFSCATSTSCSLTSASCSYGQEFNSTSCKCICNTGFYTDTCSSYNCSYGNLDIDSTLCTGVDCTTDLYRLYCPYTCFSCSGTSSRLISGTSSHNVALINKIKAQVSKTGVGKNLLGQLIFG